MLFDDEHVCSNTDKTFAHVNMYIKYTTRKKCYTYISVYLYTQLSNEQRNN